jgi:hypothetical protein
VAGVEEQPRPWYAPGLYARVQERRRNRPPREQRVPLWQRIRARGLKWTDQLIVGLFIAVVAASFATVALAHPAQVRSTTLQQDPGATLDATPTPGCIAAPIPGSTRRVCGY